MTSKEDVKIICNKIFKENECLGSVYSDNLNGNTRILIENFDGSEEAKDKVSCEIKKELGQNITVFI